MMLSVVIATYNGARFLDQQLASLAVQTHRPDEVVICDDGSTDATIAVAERFAASAPFAMRIAPNPGRLGFRGNFMRAASLAAGELIAFCDQDDIWSPDKLARVVARFAAADAPVLVRHNARLVDGEGEDAGLLFARSVRDHATQPPAYLPFFCPQGFTLTFRRALLDYADLWPWSIDEHFPPERMAHDQWYFFLATALGTTAYLAAPLADYRQHGGNVYGTASGLFRRLGLEDLRHRVTLYRNIEKRIVGLMSRRHVLARISAAGRAPAGLDLAPAIAVVDAHIGRLEGQLAIWRGQSAGERRRALGQLRRAGGYGDLSTGRIDARDRYFDMIGALVGARRLDALGERRGKAAFPQDIYQQLRERFTAAYDPRR